MSADVDPAIAVLVAGCRSRFFEALAEALEDAAQAMRDDGHDEHVIACAGVSATATAYVVTLIENVPLRDREATHADVVRSLRGHLDCAAIVDAAGLAAVPVGATVQ